MRRILLLGMSALLVVGTSGCGGEAAGPDDTLPPSPTPQIGISIAPDPAYAGYPVTLSVTVSSLHAAVKSVSVDFTNDGVVDEVRTFNQRRVTTVFNPTYDAAGTHAARAEATFETGEPISAVLPVTMNPLAEVPVRAQVVASSRAAEASCYALGPPTTCEGCEAYITYLVRSIDVGSLAHGSPVSVTQRFQSRGLFGCRFNVAIIAGPPGAETVIGESGCVTQPNSPDSGPVECSVTAAAQVP